MSFKIISANDCIKGYNHPTVPTAINNFLAFEKHWKTKNSENPAGWIDLQDIEHFSNDQDLEHLPTLEELIEDYLSFPSKYASYIDSKGQKKRKMFTCRILASQVWSSEKSIYDKDLDSTGYDRPITQTLNQALHLNHLIGDKKEEPKGFTNHDCMMLAGLVRISRNEDTGVHEVTVTKPEGNGRIVKILITTKGDDIYIPFQISFHEENLTNLEMHRIEAKMHHTDAEERSSQNESQKFSSGYNAGIPQYVFCYEFLWDLELDFDGVMNAKRAAEGKPPWISVSSISMINRGEKEGMFQTAKDGSLHSQQPGEDYARLAHQIAKTMVEITKEKIIYSSAIQGIASMLHSFCQNFNYSTQNTSVRGATFTEDMMTRYLKEFAEVQAKDAAYFAQRDADMGYTTSTYVPFKVKDLALTASTKSIEAICVRKFWKNRHITEWWMRDTKKKQGFSEHDSNVKHFVNKCRDPSTRNEMKRLIASG